METAGFYETIFMRKSIRKFDAKPLDEKILGEIASFLKNLKPLDSGIMTEIKILGKKDIRTIQGKAPHYLAVFSENKEGYLTNIGYMFQQADLFFSANGIGCCWQGIPNLTGEALKSSGLEFVIVLAFGIPAVTLHRESISEFDREPIEKMRDFTGADDILEPARLAPSAMNGQPWFFTGSRNAIHMFCVKPMITGKWSRIDCGIALYHLRLAAEHSGMGVAFAREDQAKNNPPRGYFYITSIKAN